MSHRAEGFKKGGDHEAARHTRARVNFSLRKKNREDTVVKKRATVTGPAAAASEEEAASVRVEEVQELKDEDVKFFIAQMEAADPGVRLKATQQIRKYTSTTRAARALAQVTRLNVIPVVVSLLRATSYPEHQFEACWILTNIASCTTHHVEELLQANALEPLFAALHNTAHFTLHEQALWALANIAGDAFKYALQLVEEHHFVARLVALADKNPYLVERVEYARLYIWTLTNLCRAQFGLEKLSPLIPVLSQFLMHQDEQILFEAAYALHYITEVNPYDKDNNLQIDAILSQPGVCNRLIRLLASPYSKVVRPVLKVLGNIASGTPVHTGTLLREGVVAALEPLFTHTDGRIVHQLCFAVSNIAGENREHADAVLHFIPKLSALASATNSAFRCRLEATWCIVNMVIIGSEDQIAFMAKDATVIQSLCEMLSSEEPDLIASILQGFLRLLKLDPEFAVKLEECFGLAKIESLQGHGNEQIYKLSCSLMDELAATTGKAETEGGGIQQQSDFLFHPISASSDFGLRPLLTSAFPIPPLATFPPLP